MTSKVLSTPNADCAVPGKRPEKNGPDRGACHHKKCIVQTECAACGAPDFGAVLPLDDPPKRGLEPALLAKDP